jgi:hypothetical protein
MLNMRQAAYISILIGLWLFSMAALMLGMDSLGIRPSFRTHGTISSGDATPCAQKARLHCTWRRACAAYPKLGSRRKGPAEAGL